jgi:site-specific DNA recombinase
VAIACPVIIPDDLFEAAGRVSRDNSKWSPRRAEPGTWLLRRLVSCGTCQVHLVAHRARRRAGGWIRYYACPNHDRLRAAGAGGYCPERRVRADELDAFVFEAVRAALADPAMLIAGEAALVSKVPAPDDELLGAQLVRLDRRIQTADAERRRLADLYQAGLVELEELTRRATELDGRRRRLAAERSALFDQRETLLKDNQLRRRIAGFADRVIAALPTLDFDQRQQLLRTVVEDVAVQGWEVEIRLRVPVDGLPDDRPKVRSRHRSRAAVSSDDGLRFIGRDDGRVRPPVPLPRSGPYRTLGRRVPRGAGPRYRPTLRRPRTGAPHRWAPTRERAERRCAGFSTLGLMASWRPSAPNGGAAFRKGSGGHGEDCKIDRIRCSSQQVQEMNTAE